MKQYLFFFSILLLLTSCMPNVIKGEGKQTTQKYDVVPFKNVLINIPAGMDVFIEPSSVYDVSVTGYENVLKKIKVIVSNDTLRIEPDVPPTWTLYDHDNTKITLRIPTLCGLSALGAINTHIIGKLDIKHLNLAISGVANVTIDSLYTPELTTAISGAGNVKVGIGKVQNAKYAVSGTASIKNFALETENTKAAISGTGDIEVTATVGLKASVSGVGEIWYKGNPKVEQSIAGVGTVKPAN